ncbi:MAG: glycosyltransferase [Solirubrobacterales bacterium]
MQTDPVFASEGGGVPEARLLLISPVHNEAEHIAEVAHSVAAQTRPPDLWLVVDDESDDHTLERLRELEPEIAFLRVLSVPTGLTHGSGDRLAAAAVERAYSWGIESVDWRSFSHIGKLDGDTVLPVNYLEGMLERFEADPSLGVAGGALTERSNGEWRTVPTPRDHATAPARIYRRECFERIGGVVGRLGSDPIAVTYARMNGYGARAFPELPVRHLRPMGSRQGILRGRIRHGTTHYIVGYGFPWAFVRSLMLAVRTRPPVLGGAAFLYGYLRAAFGSTERVRDNAFRVFVRHEQRRRVLSVLGPVRDRLHRGDRRQPGRGDPPSVGQALASRSEEERQRRRQVVEVLRTLEAHGDRNGWVGSDPYEGLNAARLVPLQRSFRGRQLISQAVKRSPLDLRPLLGIEPTLNSATVAWVVSSYALDGFLPEETAEDRLAKSLKALRGLRCRGFEEPCWGYPFDTQSRVFFYSRTSPNTIATAFAANALLDAFERTGQEDLLEEAMGAGRFFLRHILQTEADKGAYFAYIVGDRAPVQNANTHVCAVLARLTQHRDDDEFRTAAEAGIEYALSRQRRDGSWLYGERPDLAWVDGYHHGYVLDALRVCSDAGLDERLPEAIDRGLEFYRRELILPDGTPKYFSHKVYPIDSQSVAQAIQTFSIAATRDPSFIEPARRVFDWSLENMRRPDGLFMFQRRRHWSNSLPHIRWVVAAKLLACIHLLRAERMLAGESEERR